MSSRKTAPGHGQLSHAPAPIAGTARLPTCAEHPGALVRPYRSHGPDGPGVYPQCVPTTGETPHLLAWSEAAPDQGAEPESATLSPSELTVLEDAALGLTVIETARKRRKSSETIKSQRRSILLKLGARNMPHAIALVMRDESIEMPRVA